MGDDEQSQPAKRLRDLRLPPLVTITTEALGPLTFRDPNMRNAMDLARADPRGDQPPGDFVSLLLGFTGRRVGDDEEQDRPSLTPEEVSQLTAEERQSIVSGLIAGMPQLFFEPRGPRKAEDGPFGPHEADETRLRLPREDGESDEAYLQRGWREHWKAMMAKVGEWEKSMRTATSGLSDAWKQSVIPDLLANRVAASNLTDQIARVALGSTDLARALAVRRTTPSTSAALKAALGDIDAVDGLTRGAGAQEDLAARLKREAMAGPFPIDLPQIKIPPNPLHQTNDLLGTIGGHIADMRDLAAKTAEMQVSMNDAASNILTLFSVGAAEARDSAAKAEKNGKTALRVANITAGLTLLAIVTAIWAVVHQDDQNRRHEAAAVKDAAGQLKALQDNTAASNRLAAALEAQRKSAAADNPVPVRERPKAGGHTPKS